MNLTLSEQYTLVTSTNHQYLRNRDHWNFLLESYMGGVEWQRGNHLTKYVNETQGEYNARIAATHLENHSRSVISTYISFLFRTLPERDFAGIEYDVMLESFLEDADYDGRSLDAFMKEVAVWSSVFGHSWVIITKPNIGAQTKGDELSQDVRPYLNLLTPLTVTDWTYTRMPNGRYKLEYLKYVEDANDSVGVIKEWYPTEIHTYVVNHKTREVTEHMIEVNPFNDIPAICAYNQKSPVRGIGISDISDIAMAQRSIYNLTSEVESSIRINGHPTLVKTAGSEASAGAGSVIQIEDNLDPGLKPYMLAVSTDIQSIFTAIEHTTTVIDKMANTGSIRATESRRMSGVAQEQEFQLLNAKLSEKADNLQLTEEQIWQWYAYYQGLTWAGKIEYPDSFAISDTGLEIQQLQTAKNTATDPAVLRKIDEHILEWMGEEKEYLPFIDPNPQPGRLYPDGEEINANLPAAYQPASNAEVPEGQNCGNCEYYKPGELYCTKFDAPVRAVYWCAKWEPYEEEYSIMTAEIMAEIQQMIMDGMTNAEIMAQLPGITVEDIVKAAAEAARNNN